MYKKLRMPVNETVRSEETKRQARREKDRTRATKLRREGRKGRSKHEAHHIQQQRKENAKMMKEARGLVKVSLKHTGKANKLVSCVIKTIYIPLTLRRISLSMICRFPKMTRVMITLISLPGPGIGPTPLHRGRWNSSTVCL